MSSSSHIRCPELLAPAGNMTCLQAALDAGADSIYIGLDRFNMRWEAAHNFTLAELPEASRRCRARGVRLYLTLNCIVFESELAELAPLVAAAQPHIDAAIVSDWAVIELCRQHGIPCHISTQMSVSNSAAARRLKDLGAKRIVLARECTLAEVAVIRRAVDVELETFVHGAMCVAISGRCLLSHEAFGLSCNRGECRQPCRRKYLIQELDGENAAFVVGRNYVLSPRDLCSLPFLDELIAAGLDAFKIEGRSRNPEYVHTVVGAYRAALDAWQQGRLDAALKADLTARCRRVFNREFSTGLYFGRPAVGDFTPDEGNRATHRKAYAGRVINYYAQAGMAQIDVLDEAVVTGDALSIQGPTTGVVDVPATLLRRDEALLTEVACGWFTVACPRAVRRGDQVYVLRPLMVHPAAGQERRVPAMGTGVPQPGHFVRVTAPEYAGTGVYHGLYLPTDWKPGQTFPVIVEYAGNECPPVCTGRVEDCKLGYYASGGAGYIWLVLPFVNAAEKRNQLRWWGDVAATVAYCELNLRRTCDTYGGDRARVLLTGFSRGAIACGYIGLHDDTIAALWAGLMPAAHCDGGSFTREGAPQRLSRIGNRPVLIIYGQNDEAGKANSLAGGKILQEQGRHPTYIEIPGTGHTDTWIEQPSPQRTALRHWMAQVPAKRP